MVHLEALKRHDDVEIAALCDIDEQEVQKKSAKYGGKAYTDFKSMLEEETLDAVWLCTPPQVRYEPLRICAEQGIPVFCEKPVARSMEDAEETAEMLRRHDARVQVGYVFRSMPVVDKLREASADDEIWAVSSFYCSPLSTKMDFPAWFYDKSLSGGGLVDQATHNFDLLRNLFGNVSEVKGTAANPVHPKKEGYTVDEVISLSMRFSSGMICSHTHTWLAEGWRNEIQMSGKKRFYRLVLWTGELLVDSKGEEVLSYKQPSDSIYIYENDVFLQMVRTNEWDANPCTFDDAVESLRLTLACDEAIETGSSVTLR